VIVERQSLLMVHRRKNKMAYSDTGWKGWIP